MAPLGPVLFDTSQIACACLGLYGLTSLPDGTFENISVAGFRAGPLQDCGQGC